MEIQSSLKKNAQFPFCGQTKAFRYQIVIQGIQPCFFSRWNPWPVLNRTKAAKFLKKFQVHSVLKGGGKYVFKREFLYF